MFKYVYTLFFNMLNMQGKLIVVVTLFCFLFLATSESGLTGFILADDVICGSIIDSDVVLSSDILGCNDTTILEVRADDVTLDCAGHILSGEDSVGIYVSGSGVTVKNCNVILRGEESYGVFFGGDNINFVDNKIEAPGEYSIAGIIDYDKTGIVIEGNTIMGGEVGIQFYSDAYDNVVRNNIITMGKSTAIMMGYGNSGHIIEGNTITSGSGVILYLSSNKNTPIEDVIFRGNTFNCGLSLINTEYLGTMEFYNNVVNCKKNIVKDFLSVVDHIDWNTNIQAGERILTEGSLIGGNYWTNPSGTGFSDTCTDDNMDGFCDEAFEIYENNLDNYPLSNDYVSMNLECGSEIDSDVTLTGDILDCEENVILTITADDVILDCNDHVLSGNDVSGILVEGTGVTVKNCNIKIIGDYSSGIHLKSNNNNILNNNVNVGFQAISIDSEKTGNVIEENKLIADDTTIQFSSGSYANTIRNNMIKANKQQAIRVSYGNTRHIIENNKISSGIGEVIYLYSSEGTPIEDIIFRGNEFNCGTALITTEYLGTMEFYNNKINCDKIINDWLSVVDHIDWGVKPHVGERIYTEGNLIGGNYWTNPSGTGFSDNCIDENFDGFCDEAFEINEDNLDNYALSNNYVAIDLECGSKIIRDTILDKDIVGCSGGTALEILSDDITLDCNGYTIQIEDSIEERVVRTPIYDDEENLIGFDETIENVAKGTEGIKINADGVTVKNCNVVLDGEESRPGIFVTGSDITVIDNVVNADDASLGILVKGGNNNVIKNNEIVAGKFALQISESEGNIISDNIVTSNEHQALRIYHSHKNTLIGNTFTSKTGEVVYIYDTIGALEGENTLIGNKIICPREYSEVKDDRVFEALRLENIDVNFYNNYIGCYIPVQLINAKISTWNVDIQDGERVYSSGDQISGNYWSNPDYTGHSDICVDDDDNGFCDESIEFGEGQVDNNPATGSNKLCGAVIRIPEFSIDSDIYCKDSYLEITEKYAGIDCNGHTIFSIGDYAIYSENEDFIEIKNCNIVIEGDGTAIGLKNVYQPTITNNEITADTLAIELDGVKSIISDNKIVSGGYVISLSGGENSFYLNTIESVDGVVIGKTFEENIWYSEDGGNYWTNSEGTGFSDICLDENFDGFCDEEYDLDPQPEKPVQTNDIGIDDSSESDSNASLLTKEMVIVNIDEKPLSRIYFFPEPYCGDLECGENETCSSCVGDCGACPVPSNPSSGPSGPSSPSGVTPSTITPIVKTETKEPVNVVVQVLETDPFETQIFTDVISDEVVEMNIDRDLLVTSVLFRVAENADSVEVTVEDVESDNEFDTLIYNYFEVTADQPVDGATIEFKVDNVWLADNGLSETQISLFHYDDGWIELTTKSYLQDAKYSYFRAETSGFSLFAIGESKFGASIATGFGVSDGEAPALDIFTVLIGVIVLLGGLYLFIRLGKGKLWKGGN